LAIHVGAATPVGHSHARVPSAAERWGTWLGQRAGTLLVIGVTAVACVIPVYFVFRRVLDLGWSGIVDLAGNSYTQTVAWDTVRLTAGTVVIAVVLGTVLAWFAHCLPPSRRWLSFIPLFPLIMPPLAVVVGYYFLFNHQVGYVNNVLRKLPVFHAATGPVDVQSFAAITVVSGLVFSAFMFLFVRSSMAQIQQDFIDAAVVSGAGPLKVFFKVVLPVIRPGLVFGALTVVLLAIGQFTVPLLLGRASNVNVLTTAMFNAINRYPTRYDIAAAYGLPIVFAGLAFIAFQRWMLRDSSRFETTGGKGGGRPLTHNGWAAQLFLAVYGLLTVVLPVFAIGVVSVQPFWNPTIRVEDFTLEHYREVLFRREELVATIQHSVSYAVLTVLVILPLAFVAARAIYRRREQPIIGLLQELIISLPLGIPAVIMGTGFLLFFVGAPFGLYGSHLSMIITYSVIMLPFVTRMQLAAMNNLGPTLSDAATVHGANWLTRSLRIELPLLRPALGSGAALAILLISHEFSASVLIRSRETQVMGTILYDLWTFGSYAETAVMAVLMCVITLVAVGVALFIGGSSSIGRAEAFHV
jgi:iron(III) transport system permease protein